MNFTEFVKESWFYGDELLLLSSHSKPCAKHKIIANFTQNIQRPHFVQIWKKGETYENISK